MHILLQNKKCHEVIKKLKCVTAITVLHKEEQIIKNNKVLPKGFLSVSSFNLIKPPKLLKSGCNNDKTTVIYISEKTQNKKMSLYICHHHISQVYCSH